MRDGFSLLVSGALAPWMVVGCSVADPASAPEVASDELRQGTPRACVPQACTSVVPSDPLVTDFEDLSVEGAFVDNDSFSNPNPNWWLEFYGSTYVYPEGPHDLSSSIEGAWRISGTVQDWAGFGLWLGACSVDLTQYRGVSFKMWGNAGPSGRMRLIVDTGPNSVPETCRTNVGSCDAGAGPCTSPVLDFDLPSSSAEPVVVLWEELSGGQPAPGVDPAKVLQIRWSFEWYDWAEEASDPYPVELFVDDVALVE